jgi:ABC-type branched-subunit amino acid transport system ATPase component
MATILEARALSKSFGAVTAANDINVRVRAGQRGGTDRQQRSRKTTFINMVTGYLKPSAGSILYQGRDITGLQPRQITQLGICRSFRFRSCLTRCRYTRTFASASASPSARPSTPLRQPHRSHIRKSIS